MALNIKDPDTDRLARDLAEATGESITDAVRGALEERLRRVRARGIASTVRDEMDALVDRGRARATLDDRPAEVILGYGDDGLPR